MRRVLVALLVFSAGLGSLPDAARAQPAPGDVVVNEIQYAPTPSTNEFVELFNRSGETVDLASCEYADANLDFDPVAASPTPLAPGAYAVLVRDPAAFQSAFPDVAFLAPAGWEALNNGGDRVALRCDGVTVDAVPYDDAWGGSDGASLERVDPFGPSDEASNFGSSTAPGGATPGAQNTRFATDTTPPDLVRALASDDGLAVTASFSEALDPASIAAAAFALDPASAPSIAAATVDAADPSVVRLALGAPLASGSYTLTAQGVRDLRGNVQPETAAAFAFFQADAPRPGDVVVNELMADPAGSGEYVELFNRSDRTFDLQAFTLSDDRNDPVPLADAPTPVPPGAFVVLVADAGAFGTVFPDVDPVAVAPWPALNNGGDTPTLRAGPDVIDAVPYTDAWGGGNGVSLERVDPAGPSDAAVNFGASQAASGGTPGRQNSLFAPDTEGPTLVFAEQSGASEVTAFFSEPVAPAGLEPEAFDLDGTAPEAATPVSGDAVRLRFGRSLDGAPDGSTLTARGVSDLTGNATGASRTDLAYRPRPGDLVVNEILFDPLADDFDDRPNQPEYVELLSLSRRPVSLSGLALTDAPDETGAADTIRVGRRAVLPADGFGVVFADPDAPDAGDPFPDGYAPAATSTLARAYPDADWSGVALLPVNAASLGLRNDGDRVQVNRLDADGEAGGLDAVTYDPDWHADALDDTKGTSLERISATGPSSDADNWTSSATPAGGTPGAANAVSLAPPDDAATGLTIAPSPFSIERDGATRIRYVFDAVPNLVRARIFDAMGREVRVLEDAALTGRTGELLWNGRDDAGRRVRIGIYVVLVEAVRAESGAVDRYKRPVVLARPLN